MKRIDQDIKEGKLNNVYLLHGIETYLRNQYRDKLIKALSNDGDTMNTSSYLGKNIPIGEIIDIAETMPFLAEQRLIVIEDSGLFTPKGSDDKLAEYLKNFPETTYFVFSEENVDKRSKMYKSVSANGYCASFDRMSYADLKKWVIISLKKDGRLITERAYELFMGWCGNDMMKIKSEMEKLVSYTYGRDSIDIDDVRAICTPRIEDKIFDMMNFMIYGKTDMAMKLYGDLLALQADPDHVLSMIIRQLRLMLHVRMMRRDSRTVKEKAKLLGVEDFVVQKLATQSDGIDRYKIENAIDFCANTVLDTRTGNLNSKIATELVIVTLSQGEWKK